MSHQIEQVTQERIAALTQAFAKAVVEGGSERIRLHVSDKRRIFM